MWFCQRRESASCRFVSGCSGKKYFNTIIKKIRVSSSFSYQVWFRFIVLFNFWYDNTNTANLYFVR